MDGGNGLADGSVCLAGVAGTLPRQIGRLQKTRQTPPQAFDKRRSTSALPGLNSLLCIMKRCLVKATVLIKLGGEGVSQPGFAQVAVFPGSLAGLLVGLHGWHYLPACTVHLRLYQRKLVGEVHRGQAGEALEQAELLLECLLALGALGGNAQLAGTSETADKRDDCFLQPHGSCHQEGAGQVRIFLNAFVIAKKSGDPGFGTIYQEETQLVINPLEVRKVPFIVEGRASPGDPLGR